MIGHTRQGAWRYQENNWVSRAGDTVYEVAGLSHTPESLDDTEVFLHRGRAAVLRRGRKTVRWQENHKTSLSATPTTARPTASWPATRPAGTRNRSWLSVGGERDQRADVDGGSTEGGGPDWSAALRLVRVAAQSSLRQDFPMAATPVICSRMGILAVIVLRQRRCRRQ